MYPISSVNCVDFGHYRVGFLFRTKLITYLSYSTQIKNQFIWNIQFVNARNVWLSRDCGSYDYVMNKRHLFMLTFQCCSVYYNLEGEEFNQVDPRCDNYIHVWIVIVWTTLSEISLSPFQRDNLWLLIGLYKEYLKFLNRLYDKTWFVPVYA
jgi:hypothetical protein